MFRRNLKSLSIVATVIMGSASSSYAAPFTSNAIIKEIASEAITYARTETNAVNYEAALNYVRGVKAQTNSNSEKQASQELANLFRAVAAGNLTILTACQVIQTPQQKESCVQQIMNSINSN